MRRQAPFSVPSSFILLLEATKESRNGSFFTPERGAKG